MARRSRNTLALAVLGLLMEQPSHPYEMAQTLRRRNKGTSFKVTTGSLYDVVEGLERDGWIRAVETGRDGNRPERTVYEHTELGLAEFQKWIDELIRVPVNEYPKFVAAVSYVGVLGVEGAVDALTERAERLAKSIEETDEYVEAVHVPRLFMIEVEYAQAIRRAEVEWLRRTAAEMTEGTITWPKPGEY
ncbi:PadR family transcriptional regulator [Kutzneria kofuensis]|uniref:DNA-binding PadR family transcriptional regulator n=1 Tax=Kutzneria kofuensis TaxID=103725 RepID=A0A7W9KAI2_9PSEU|nr:PadR family transcriptional regulator [Kutzneria kofuensis]MBB5889047.1 DNA-binding PadR family transcriptional regulator [Kutzneria kofuensis]